MDEGVRFDILIGGVSEVILGKVNNIMGGQ